MSAVSDPVDRLELLEGDDVIFFLAVEKDSGSASQGSESA